MINLTEEILNFLNNNKGIEFTRKQIAEALNIEGLEARQVSGRLLKPIKDGVVLTNTEAKTVYTV